MDVDRSGESQGGSAEARTGRFLLQLSGGGKQDAQPVTPTRTPTDKIRGEAFVLYTGISYARPKIIIIFKILKVIKDKVQKEKVNRAVTKANRHLKNDADEI